MAGVSRGTVSRVVNEQRGVKSEVRARVLQIIAETGYIPHAQARSLAGGKTQNIGVAVFGDDPDFLTHHIFYEVLLGVQSYLTKSEYDLLLFSNRAASDSEYWKRIGDQRKVDGLIVMGEHIREDYLLYYREKGLPFVLVGKRNFPVLPLICVTSNYRQGAYDATKHLLNQGRKKLMLLSGNPETFHEAEKTAGFKQAVQEAAGATEATGRVINGVAQQKYARRLVSEILAKEGLRFDGLMAGNDLMAFGAIEALREFGAMVPEEVAVIGYDDVFAARHFHPSLTTVRQNKKELGVQAASLLLQVLDGKLDPTIERDVTIGNDLIERDSG